MFKYIIIFSCFSYICPVCIFASQDILDYKTTKDKGTTQYTLNEDIIKLFEKMVSGTAFTELPEKNISEIFSTESTKDDSDYSLMGDLIELYTSIREKAQEWFPKTSEEKFEEACSQVISLHIAKSEILSPCFCDNNESNHEKRERLEGIILLLKELSQDDHVFPYKKIFAELQNMWLQVYRDTILTNNSYREESDNNFYTNAINLSYYGAQKTCTAIQNIYNNYQQVLSCLKNKKKEISAALSSQQTKENPLILEIKQQSNELDKIKKEVNNINARLEKYCSSNSTKKKNLKDRIPGNIEAARQEKNTISKRIDEYRESINPKINAIQTRLAQIQLLLSQKDPSTEMPKEFEELKQKATEEELAEHKKKKKEIFLPFGNIKVSSSPDPENVEAEKAKRTKEKKSLYKICKEWADWQKNWSKKVLDHAEKRERKPLEQERQKLEVELLKLQNSQKAFFVKEQENLKCVEDKLATLEQVQKDLEQLDLLAKKRTKLEVSLKNLTGQKQKRESSLQKEQTALSASINGYNQIKKFIIGFQKTLTLYARKIESIDTINLECIKHEVEQYTEKTNDFTQKIQQGLQECKQLLKKVRQAEEYLTEEEKKEESVCGNMVTVIDKKLQLIQDSKTTCKHVSEAILQDISPLKKIMDSTLCFLKESWLKDAPNDLKRIEDLKKQYMLMNDLLEQSSLLSSNLTNFPYISLSKVHIEDTQKQIKIFETQITQWLKCAQESFTVVEKIVQKLNASEEPRFFEIDHETISNLILPFWQVIQSHLMALQYTLQYYKSSDNFILRKV